MVHRCGGPGIEVRIYMLRFNDMIEGLRHLER